MSYLHINNLYKDQTILLFKESYALEKIHGSSSHISWQYPQKQIHFFGGGEKYENFVALFDVENLRTKFNEMFPDQNIVIFGEVYGGKQQGMSHTYGKDLKFIGFDVKINDMWLNVPNAENVCRNLNLEFVSYEKISTDLVSLISERDKESIQAIRNGMGNGKKREGIVLRPLVEMKLNNGERVIAKFKPDENNETKTKREISAEQLKVLEDAKAIAEEWVTNMRLEHVLQKFPEDVNMESAGDIIKAMIEDVYREGKGELVESREANKAIGGMTIKLFKQKLQNKIQ